MYGRTEGYLIQDMDEEQLARKKELCLEHLEVLRLIDPDMIRLNIYAASAHFELHLPLLQVERPDNPLVQKACPEMWDNRLVFIYHITVNLDSCPNCLKMLQPQ